MEQAPVCNSEIVEPWTEQTKGVLVSNATGNFELAKIPEILPAVISILFTAGSVIVSRASPLAKTISAFVQVAPNFVAADAMGGTAKEATIGAVAVRIPFLMTDTISNSEFYSSAISHSFSSLPNLRNLSNSEFELQSRRLRQRPMPIALLSPL